MSHQRLQASTINTSPGREHRRTLSRHDSAAGPQPPHREGEDTRGPKPPRTAEVGPAENDLRSCFAGFRPSEYKRCDWTSQSIVDRSAAGL